MQGEATAVDTPFGECSEEECTVLLDDDKIDLQRVTIDIPADTDVTGMASDGVAGSASVHSTLRGPCAGGNSRR